MTKPKSSGPITQEGKEIASKNALAHGATAKHLLNNDEENRYRSILRSLQKTYPKKHPLIQLQIERIARLHIQLERIQNSIDASFKKTRAQSVVFDKLTNILQMNTFERALAGKITISWEKP
jgi:hypothetical protein